jgi:hypothetical protein
MSAPGSDEFARRSFEAEGCPYFTTSEKIPGEGHETRGENQRPAAISSTARGPPRNSRRMVRRTGFTRRRERA